VKFTAGPGVAGCEALRVIFRLGSTWALAAAIDSDKTVMARDFMGGDPKAMKLL
jgi:hypothetical protein